MNRHAKDLQNKSRRHIVIRLNNDLFDVESFTSGDSHLVRRSYTGHLSCDCAWAAHHPYKACSHILAVHEWEANTNTITLSFWTDYADAHRQHRSVVRVDNDLLATQRHQPIDLALEALRLIATQDVNGMTTFLVRHDPDYLPCLADNLPLWVAAVVSSEPFASTDTHRQALRDIRIDGLVGKRAAQAARAAL